MAPVHFLEILYMVHCDFVHQTQHFQSTLLVGSVLIVREGSHTKEYSQYALDNVDNSGRPLTMPRYSSSKYLLPLPLGIGLRQGVRGTGEQTVTGTRRQGVTHAGRHVLVVLLQGKERGDRAAALGHYNKTKQLEQLEMTIS